VLYIEELVRAAKTGDKAAMEHVVTSFKFFIIKQASKYRIPSYDFEDLIQYGNLSVIKAVKHYKIHNKKFTSYCVHSVINNYNALLKSQIKHYKELQNEDVLNLQTNDFNLEDAFICTESKKEIVQALNKLKLSEKTIINKMYFNDKTLKDIALEGNMKYSTAYSVKKSALNKLKKYLE
jgi:RNA polymerase sigma factor (sigma-70 family)